MKKILTSLLAGALLLPAALSAANFEGKVSMNMIMPGAKEPMPITLSVKEGFARNDMTMGKGMTASSIIDQAKQQITILMPDQKMYMVQPMPKPEDFSGSKDTSDFSFEKTSETAKIAGYACTKYVGKSKDGTTEIWATDQLGTYLGMGGGSPGGRGRNAPSYAWEKALVGKNFFPLRTVVIDTKGKEAMRMEATSVEKMSLPDSLFTPPADFQKLDMDMGGMMKGMMKGMIPGGGR